MNDELYEQQRARLLALSERWLEPLGLRWWKVEVEYCREGLEVKPEDAADDWQPLMRCHVRWQYLQAKISVNMPALLTVSDDALEGHFVHECLHILVHEMRMCADEKGWMEHEERVVTMLAKACLWLREAGRQDGLREAAGGTA